MRKPLVTIAARMPRRRDLVDQHADVGAEERLAAEELDPHRAQPRALAEELAMVGGRELRVLRAPGELQ